MWYFFFLSLLGMLACCILLATRAVEWKLTIEWLTADVFDIVA